MGMIPTLLLTYSIAIAVGVAYVGTMVLRDRSLTPLAAYEDVSLEIASAAALRALISIPAGTPVATPDVPEVVDASASSEVETRILDEAGKTRMGVFVTAMAWSTLACTIGLIAMTYFTMPDMGFGGAVVCGIAVGPWIAAFVAGCTSTAICEFRVEKGLMPSLYA